MYGTGFTIVDYLEPDQNGWYFSDNIFKFIFWKNIIVACLDNWEFNGALCKILQ